MLTPEQFDQWWNDNVRQNVTLVGDEDALHAIVPDDAIVVGWMRNSRYKRTWWVPPTVEVPLEVAAILKAYRFDGALGPTEYRYWLEESDLPTPMLDCEMLTKLIAEGVVAEYYDYFCFDYPGSRLGKREPGAWVRDLAAIGALSAEEQEAIENKPPDNVPFETLLDLF